MAAIVKTTVPKLGGQVAMAAAAAGDQADCGNGEELVIQTAGTPTTVTVAVPGNTWNGQPTPDTTFTTPATGISTLKLVPKYADAAIGGKAAISWSSLTGVTRGVKLDGV